LSRKACLTALALLAACGGVERPVAPPEREPPVVTFSPKLVAEPDTVLGGIRDIGLSDDGIWIVALGAIPFAHYTLETLEPSYPNRDITIGPFPVRYSYSLDVAEDGAAITWDGIVGRLLRVSTSWEVSAAAASTDLVQSPQTPGWDFLGGKRNQLFAMDDGFVLGMLESSKAGSGDFDRTRWVRIRGDQRDTVLAFDQGKGGLDSALAGPRLFGPFPLVARCGRSRAAVYYPNEKRIAVVDSSWRPMRHLTVKRVPAERTVQMAQELFISRMLISAQGTMTEAEIRKLIETAPIGAMAEAARRTPAYSRLICTPSGTVLIERFRIATLADREPNIWEVYRGDGSETLLQMPPNFRLFDANDVHLVGIILDSLDVPRVARGSWPAPP